MGLGQLACNRNGCRTLSSMAQYRIYELDPSDHITAGYTIECGSEADAMRAAGRLLQREPAAAVEVWQGIGRIGRLRAGGPWTRLRIQWIDPVAPPLNRRTTP